ncbi:hypothetical protein GCK72_015811 [Caenorhabditis remanei]|uniref:Uncharacterized protein n=1 Tax=Caenorhabditis remanei TaxID=31234 RepID=A0A6A5GXI2_CAERE|nr:hypothetical protein GCK72_015811 [Caenorhabditis remanei]KAF1759346.1 hypothetical protein GCK72_015811 [Caenorhabditis remanei]
MLIYRTFPLFLVLIYQIHSDPINIEMLVRCDPSIAHYCGKLVYYEVDYQGQHDVFKTHQFCSDYEYQQFQYEKFWPGGDPGKEYEFSFTLEHNCTHTGQRLCIRPHQYVRKYIDGEQFVEFYVKAYNRGENFDCLLALD